MIIDTHLHPTNLVDEAWRHTGEPFTGELVREARAGDRPAVIVRVGGRAYYSGTSDFVIEPDDPLRDGFPMPQDLSALAPK